MGVKSCQDWVPPLNGTKSLAQTTRPSSTQLGRHTLESGRLLLVVLATLAPAIVQAQTDVWLDVDVAAGLPNRDVDDALALIQAFHSPEIRVCGVSAVFGNAPLADGLPIAREVVEKFGPAGMTVHAGAASADELGKSNEAVSAMAAALQEKPFTLLALGPLTNVGTLLKQRPEVHSRIDSIIIVAARRPGQRFTYPSAEGRSFRDFNFENDVEAARIILDSQIPLVFAPWEVSSHVWITPDDLARNATYGGSGLWIYEKSLPWAQMWLDQFKTPGFNPFDTLAVGWITHPALMKSFPASVTIEEHPDDTADHAKGSAPLKPYLIAREAAPAAARAKYLYEPLPQFTRILHERLSGY